MVTAGIAAGYLTSPRLKEVHWQAAGRAAPGPQVSIAGESAQYVDPAEIPAGHDVARLGRALAAGLRGDLYELMAATAAYTGLRQGELFAVTAGQITPGARVITVDRKVVEVAGKLYLEAPKGRKRRSTIYPARTPAGYPLADAIADRIQQARAEQNAGANPLAVMFPPPRHLVAVLQLRPPRPGARLPGRRVARDGRRRYRTWHSLRHVFCTTGDLRICAGYRTSPAFATRPGLVIVGAPRPTASPCAVGRPGPAALGLGGQAVPGRYLDRLSSALPVIT